MSLLLAFVQVCKREEKAGLAVMGQGDNRDDKKAVRNGTESVETSGDPACWNNCLA